MGAKIALGIVLVFSVTLLALGRPLPFLQEGTEKQATNDSVHYERFEADVQALLSEFDRSVKEHFKQLQEKGDRSFKDFSQQETARSKARVEEHYEALKALGETFSAEIREKYYVPILNKQLQLVIVTLSSDERKELEEEIKTLRQTAEGLQTAKEKELETRLTAFEKEERERLSTRLTEYRENLQHSLEAEHQSFQTELKREMDREIAKMEDRLRRELITREY